MSERKLKRTTNFSHVNIGLPEETKSTPKYNQILDEASGVIKTKKDLDDLYRELLQKITEDEKYIDHHLIRHAIITPGDMKNRFGYRYENDEEDPRYFTSEELETQVFDEPEIYIRFPLYETKLKKDGVKHFKTKTTLNDILDAMEKYSIYLQFLFGDEDVDTDYPFFDGFSREGVKNGINVYDINYV